MKAFSAYGRLHASQAREGEEEGPRREALAILINEIPPSVHGSPPMGAVPDAVVHSQWGASTEYLRSTLCH